LACGANPNPFLPVSFAQAYTDWMYIWILGHLTAPTREGADVSHGSKDIIILLKRSLKWVPIVGWGM
jgi:1-acyl-sn-glycerol-3-phosphate acyltransferase